MSPAFVLLLVACTSGDDLGVPDDTGAPTPRCDATGPRDDTLTVPDVQALGTHNSYHVEPDVVYDPSHAYTQPPLDAQADLGVRHFELDFHISTDGEFRVLHLPNIDPESTCPTFAECLGTLKAWSDAHPCHAPFTVWLEPKDDLDAAVEDLQPLAGHLTELDDAILAEWPRERLIVPDDVRGSHATLPEGVADGWPLLADSRGKAMFALLDSSEHRAEYLDGAPALEGRVLFVDSDTVDDPFAGTFKIDDAVSEADAIGVLVAANFLVTSNVDEAGAGDEENEARFTGSIEGGPHGFASDHVVAQSDGSFVAELPGGSPRCHPARVPEGCGPEEIEPE